MMSPIQPLDTLLWHCGSCALAYTPLRLLCVVVRHYCGRFRALIFVQRWHFAFFGFSLLIFVVVIDVWIWLHDLPLESDLDPFFGLSFRISFHEFLQSIPRHIRIVAILDLWLTLWHHSLFIVVILRVRHVLIYLLWVEFLLWSHSLSAWTSGCH